MKLPSEYLEQGWCQGTSGRDECGGVASYKNAVSWCFAGAVANVFTPYRLTSINPDFLNFLAAAEIIIGSHATVWNDAPERTQAQVVALAQAVEEKLGLYVAEPELAAVGD